MIKSRFQKSCERCGKLYWVHLCEENRVHGPRKYCSVDCYYPTRKDGYINNGGYRVFTISGHPLAMDGQRRMVFEHWKVMYENHQAGPDAIVSLKRIGWTIHHKNGDRLDNRLENLELRAPGRHPRGWTPEDMADELRILGYEIKKPKVTNVS